MRLRPYITLIGLALLLGNASAWAGDIPWNSLSPEEQRILHRARNDWDNMSTERQRRLLRGAHRWQDMSPRQREQARERWRERR
jgi:hypothetical protein